MSITPAMFRFKFKEFEIEGDVKIQQYIDDAVASVNPVFWGAKYDLALYYLTAHYLTLGNKTEAGASNASAPVNSKSVDGVSVTYATATPADATEAYYMSTAYGQRYLALRKTIGVPACVV